MRSTSKNTKGKCVGRRKSRGTSEECIDLGNQEPERRIRGKPADQMRPVHISSEVRSHFGKELCCFDQKQEAVTVLRRMQCELQIPYPLIYLANGDALLANVLH